MKKRRNFDEDKLKEAVHNFFLKLKTKKLNKGFLTSEKLKNAN